jgi:hypothetical protein
MTADSLLLFTRVSVCAHTAPLQTILQKSIARLPAALGLVGRNRAFLATYFATSLKLRRLQRHLATAPPVAAPADEQPPYAYCGAACGSGRGGGDVGGGGAHAFGAASEGWAYGVGGWSGMPPRGRPSLLAVLRLSRAAIAAFAQGATCSRCVTADIANAVSTDCATTPFRTASSAAIPCPLCINLPKEAQRASTDADA